MLYSIKNEFMQVTVSDVGAELQSVKKASDGTEYLWQGDKRYWGSRALNPVPLCGETV